LPPRSYRAQKRWWEGRTEGSEKEKPTKTKIEKQIKKKNRMSKCDKERDAVRKAVAATRANRWSGI